MAIDLEPALNSLAIWAQKYIEAEIACEVNLSSLAWKMRRTIVAGELPNRRVVIRFHFQDDGMEYDTNRIVAKTGEPVQLCTAIPRLDVDLRVETTVPSISAIILARSTEAREIEAERMFLSGDALLARTMQRWLHVTDYLPKSGQLELSLETTKAYTAGQTA